MKTEMQNFVDIFNSQIGNLPKEKKGENMESIRTKRCWNKKCYCRKISKQYGCTKFSKPSENKCKLFLSHKDYHKNKSTSKNLRITHTFDPELINDWTKIDIDDVFVKEVKMNNSYTFRGNVNLDHLINDCIKDQKYCFLAVTKDKGIIGISKQLPIADKTEFTNKLKGCYEEEVQKSFYIEYINKSDISLAVKELTRISKLIKNRIRNTAKKLHKNSKAGKYSKLSETKVMVY